MFRMAQLNQLNALFRTIRSSYLKWRTNEIGWPFIPLNWTNIKTLLICSRQLAVCIKKQIVEAIQTNELRNGIKIYNAVGSPQRVHRFLHDDVMVIRSTMDPCSSLAPTSPNSLYMPIKGIIE